MHPEFMSATKLEMIEADRRAERARQHITRLRQLVFDMGYSPEKAILEVFDITPPTGIVIPDGPSDRDLQFMELLTTIAHPKTSMKPAADCARHFASASAP